MKVNITLNDDLMKRIDNYADENYMSRSGLISLACTQYLNQVEVLALVKDMSFAMRKIADSGKVDSESIRKLEEFEKMCRMLISKQ